MTIKVMIFFYAVKRKMAQVISAIENALGIFD
jgi:hypothetical protein